MKLQLRVWITVTLTLSLCWMIGSAQEDTNKVKMFEHRKAIQDADPGRRHLETLRMPTELLVELRDSGTHVGFDTTSVRMIKINVGHKMLVGCEWILYYFNGTERIEIGRNMGGSPGVLLGSGRMVVHGLDEVAKSQGSLQLVAELTVFETDIPYQHMWNPKEGRYKPLWKGLATAVVTENE